ncbi:MAG: response regulator transcription factor [Anaerolineae bacterium]|nr:response regulator transcription factor [Anaerolineae bacterium]
MKDKKILVVEDDSAIREVVRKYLEVEGFSVLEAISGPSALVALHEQAIDLVILDIMLPGLDGFAIARAVREPLSPQQMTTSSSVPIIALTARGDESDRLTGFSQGVDDYVVKPFSPRELVARAKAVLRRGQPHFDRVENALSIGTLNIDPARRQVLLNGISVPLTAKEFELLYTLARHAGQVFTREQLLDRVWGMEFYGDASTVTVHIRRLREKIEADPAHPAFVHTVWGVGYKFEVT